MSRRLFVVVATIVWSFSSLGAADARAQDRSLSRQDTRLLFMPSDATVPVLTPALTPVFDEAPVAAAPERAVFDRSRTKRLLPFYASTALLQALDVHSTIQVLNRGGGEGNPVLRGIVSNRPAFIAVKAAVAASTIYAASRIAKRSKVGAVVALVALNTVYAMVASHNYKLAHQMR